MFSAARCVDLLCRDLPACALQIDLRFKRPLLIPGEVALHTRQEADSTRFVLNVRPQGEPHIEGALAQAARPHSTWRRKLPASPIIDCERGNHHEHPAQTQAPPLTHFDKDKGDAHMVNIAGKPLTHRKAVAGGRIQMQQHTLDLIPKRAGRQGRCARA